MNSTSTVRLAQRLNKPEFWFQPRQLLRKFCFEMNRRPAPASARVRLPWGVTMSVNPREAIGKSLMTYAVYELAVSETLWRLTDTGDVCADIGANIGYMTSVFASAAGARGKVFSFEPHPRIYSRLAANVESWRGCATASNQATIEIERCAIAAIDGELDLIEPDEFEKNEGRSSTVVNSASFAAVAKHRVPARRLDSILAKAGNLAVVKIDVEGAEPMVLQGAAALLGQRKIRDIVFEDELPFPSQSVTLLKRHGYTIRRLVKLIGGPLLCDPSMPQSARLALPWEPVNYLATLDIGRAQARMTPRGWHCLRQKH
jgi:FkbM family methyltransferase